MKIPQEKLARSVSRWRTQMNPPMPTDLLTKTDIPSVCKKLSHGIPYIYQKKPDSDDENMDIDNVETNKAAIEKKLIVNYVTSKSKVQDKETKKWVMKDFHHLITYDEELVQRYNREMHAYFDGTFAPRPDVECEQLFTIMAKEKGFVSKLTFIVYFIIVYSNYN